MDRIEVSLAKLHEFNLQYCNIFIYEIPIVKVEII